MDFTHWLFTRQCLPGKEFVGNTIAHKRLGEGGGDSCGGYNRRRLWCAPGGGDRSVAVLPEGWQLRALLEDYKGHMQVRAVEFTHSCVFAKNTLTFLCALGRNTEGREPLESKHGGSAVMHAPEEGLL